MCVAMVIIHTKTLEKKGVDDVTPKESTLDSREPSTMSQGTALFSCGIMDLVSVGQRPVGSSLESLWDSGASSASSISGLLRDLSLSEAPSPSKRQCRSRSCSDELSWRSPWRPQASRLWTAVEKRRCHSGGAIVPSSSSSSIFSSMQRSSSFSFPTRADLPETPFPQSFTAVTFDPPRPLCCSHERICLPEIDAAPEPGSPDSASEAGGLARSQSQPCVLNDQKIGMKRRRPDEPHKQRPSLDLAKMTQKQNFQSLSCPRFNSDDWCQSNQTPPPFGSPVHQSEKAYPFGPKEDDPAVIDESDGDWTGGKEREPPWAELCGLRRDVLGGELDIEQIERN
ncbi:protein FAM53B [Ictalurus punctatus]|uniref:Protein FAM53B n=1 Tax=Ictalurus punctatus TaxID=7998 RepID=A0A2D0S6T0_ICTPU|nr:protein FAM53B [Ictalurus punctatus]XP_017338458.1 protein FAM53B [Ictalurus punctatus]XP_053541091.1 protein FAM53B [Ictalurus punctatus]